jgi:hypothetical protein
LFYLFQASDATTHHKSFRQSLKQVMNQFKQFLFLNFTIFWIIKPYFLFSQLAKEMLSQFRSNHKTEIAFNHSFHFHFERIEIHTLYNQKFKQTFETKQGMQKQKRILSQWLSAAMCAKLWRKHESVKKLKFRMKDAVCNKKSN